MQGNGELLHSVEIVSVNDLKPHPKNYVEHPEDEIAHIVQSLLSFGQYKNIVTARELTILAGHGVRQGIIKIGGKKAQIVRLDLDPFEPRAMKILAGDNEIAHLSMKDDRALTELLKSIKEEDTIGLLGTGYDETMLAALAMITRTEREIPDMNAAAHWVGMPEYDVPTDSFKIVFNFVTDEERKNFVDRHEFKIMKREAKTWTTWWPQKQRDDFSSISFEEKP